MHDLMKTLCLILSCLLGFAAVSAQPLQRVVPEQVGMDSQRLLWADEAINQAIAQKKYRELYWLSYVTARWPI